MGNEWQEATERVKGQTATPIRVNDWSRNRTAEMREHAGAVLWGICRGERERE